MLMLQNAHRMTFDTNHRGMAGFFLGDSRETDGCDGGPPHAGVEALHIDRGDAVAAS